MTKTSPKQNCLRVEQSKLWLGAWWFGVWEGKSEILVISTKPFGRFGWQHADSCTISVQGAARECIRAPLSGNTLGRRWENVPHHIFHIKRSFVKHKITNWYHRNISGEKQKMLVNNHAPSQSLLCSTRRQFCLGEVFVIKKWKFSKKVSNSKKVVSEISSNLQS